jgi:hypothetical protein
MGVLVALAVTGAMLALGAGPWRVPFVLAHLCALIALVPLGVALVAGALREGYARRRSPAGALRATAERYPLVTALVLLSFVTVAISLSQFSGGVRWVRAAANLTTVAIALTLVARYVRRGPPGRAPRS